MQIRTTARRLATLTLPAIVAGEVELSSLEAPTSREVQGTERHEHTTAWPSCSGFMVAVG